jgi:predicted acetyltransferase
MRKHDLRGLLPSPAMEIRTRAARRADLPDVYRVLDAAFTDAPVQLFIDQTEGDSTLKMRHVRVAEVDGRIAAHVRIFDRRIMIRGVPVRAGGLGSVASMPDARGLQLPTRLLRDAIDVMMRDGTAVSFLYTGIPAFYERLGWRVVREPQLDADAHEAAALPPKRRHRVRRIEDAAVPSLLAIYRRATASTTGAIVRTARTWHDAQQWLGEDPAGCLIAEARGRPVAYLRARSRDYGYNLLEAEHLPGHADAIPLLVARAAKRAMQLRQHLTTYAAADSPLAATLRTLPSTRETTDVRYPMMMRIVSLDALIEALLPRLIELTRANPGRSFTLGLRADGDQSLTLDVGSRSVRTRRRGSPQFTLDEDTTLDAVLGQLRASDLVRPRPPADVRRRIDALFPETALHFWNSDRI